MKVLRNEEIVKEKAGAVLSILRSSEMKQASARWLKEAIERSLTGQTEDEKVKLSEWLLSGVVKSRAK